MDEQPKPAARRTATRNPAKTATKTAAKTSAKAAAPAKNAAKASPRKRTVAARQPSTSDRMDSLDAPALAQVRETRPDGSATNGRVSQTWPASGPDRGHSHGARTDPRTMDLIARLGPDARDWVARARERYPAATPAAVARLAATQHREQAWLVLAIAAAYGLDPTDPCRAEDFRELHIYSGRSGLEHRARNRYSQETRLYSSV